MPCADCNRRRENTQHNKQAMTMTQLITNNVPDLVAAFKLNMKIQGYFFNMHNHKNDLKLLYRSEFLLDSFDGSKYYLPL